METLQRAFQNIYDTMDAIDTFKLKALDSMKTTVTALEAEVAKSKGYIARAEGASQAQASVGGADRPLAALGACGRAEDERGRSHRPGGQRRDRTVARASPAVRGNGPGAAQPAPVYHERAPGHWWSAGAVRRG